MIYYTTDSNGVFVSAVDLDEYAPLPAGTFTPPPECETPEVAQLQDLQWVVLPGYPLPIPPARTRADVLADLAALDTKSIRALRENNATRISELEAQAIALRAELAAL